MKAWLGGSMDDIVAMMRPEAFEICKPFQQEKLAATNFSVLKSSRQTPIFKQTAIPHNKKCLKIFCI